jgi:hypothetical protein
VASGSILSASGASVNLAARTVWVGCSRTDLGKKRFAFATTKKNKSEIQSSVSANSRNEFLDFHAEF